jgi:polysaccharide export outer membrane protein
VYFRIQAETLSRKDYIRARFSGKKVLFPDEIKPIDQKPEYLIGADDVLSVSIWNQPDLATDVIVRKDGLISLPLIGDITAEGLSIPELRDIIRKKYDHFIENPQVTVNPKEINSLRVFLVGQVRKPNVNVGPVRLGFILRGGNSLLEALSDVEFYPDADLAASYVAREDFVIPVELKALLKDGDITQNIILQPRDKIVVPGPMKKITILGEVKTPGTFKLNMDSSLTEALSNASGINRDSADLYMAYVARKKHVLPVNMKRLLDMGDISQDILMEDGDIIYIPNINEQKFYVLGEVARPGVFHYTDPVDVIEGVALAGGFLISAKRAQAVVVRGGIHSPQLYEINLLSMMEGKSLQRFTLQKGDIVYIPRTAIGDWNAFASQMLPTFYGAYLIDLIRRH